MNKKMLFLLLLSCLFAANKHPIVLIHGFLGWGREELNNYYYWGGKSDFQEELKREGFFVYTVSVGPVSSNWDRAVEAFAQIKGGCVDYGKTHSETFGIIQKPENKCFDGLYPQWDAEHPIHIIGHSQGGLTARRLELLLKNVYENEDSQLLSNSYAGWITSITTISTPHDGTTLAPIVFDIFPFAQHLSSWVGSVGSFETFYDFDLDQWDIQRRENETAVDFWGRIKRSKINSSKNFSAWDLSLDGAQSFNSIYKTDPDVYYFTYSSFATRRQKNSYKHVPDSEMSLLLWPTGLLLGQSDYADDLWSKNDGIVNTVSMFAPTSGNSGPEPAIIYSGTPEKGVWQNVNTLHVDHHHIVGGHLSESQSMSVLNIYSQHCRILYSLE